MKGRTLEESDVSILARIIGEPCSTCSYYQNSHLKLNKTKEEIDMCSEISKSSTCESCSYYDNYKPTEGCKSLINNYLEKAREDYFLSLSDKESEFDFTIETKELNKAVNTVYKLKDVLEKAKEDIDYKIRPKNKIAESLLEKFQNDTFKNESEEDHFLNMTVGIVEDL